MADKKIIAVVGATGAQGGGLARAILADPNGGFALRAITRDTSKDKAKALAAAGAEVVSADLDNVESLKKAFAGAHGVFGITNFWEHFSAEKEKAQAKNIAEAAKAAGVKHVIWSTLEDTRQFMSPDDKRMPFLQEKYRVPHFDAKAEANAFFSGVPSTMLVTSFYWDNLYMFQLAPKKDDSGQYAWAFPMGNEKLAGIAAEDIGKCAYGIFKAGSQYIGKTVGIAGEFLTIRPDGPDALEEPRSRSGEVQRRRARRLPELGLPRRRRDGQHVPGRLRFREADDGQPEPGRGAQAQSGAPDVRPVRYREEDADSCGCEPGSRHRLTANSQLPTPNSQTVPCSWSWELAIRSFRDP